MTTRNWHRNIGALLAVSLALGAAACGSSSNSSGGSGSKSNQASGGSSAQPGKGKPPFVLGDKNFPEENTLGELYAQALRAKGYTVTVKANIGSSEITDKALTSGKIDGYPEYTGVIATELAHLSDNPRSAQQTFQLAKKWENGRGFAVLNQTPFEDADAVTTTPQFAKAHNLKTIADLKKLPSFSFGAPPENRTRFQGLVGLHQAYGLKQVKFVPLAIGLLYPALDKGKVDTSTGFTTDGQLATGKYIVLKDTKHIFGFQNVVPVISKKKLAAEGPAFAQTINAVSSKLTNQAVQALNKAVVLDKHSSADVARAFLKANGLI